MALEQPEQQRDLALVIGLDGKRYRPQAPKPPAERTIVDRMNAAVVQLGKDVRKIVALTQDPSFSRYREQIYAGSHGDLQYLSGQLEAVVSRLRGLIL
jgi:hypothetical protein